MNNLLIFQVSTCFFLGLSAALVRYVLNLRRDLKELKNKKAKETYDCAMLLQDLLAHEGLIKITRIAPSDYFLKSPRA